MTRLTSRLSIVLACQLFVGVGAAIAHCPEIHKACDRPIRTCQTNTDCSGAECADGVCDTSVSTATRCFVNTQLNAAFDVQDFPSVADQRVPDAGNLPIVEVSGNAVCAAGPSLPCVIGFAGSTGNGLPGDGSPGLVSF